MAKLTIRRDKLRLRDLLRGGRLAGVAVTVGVAETLVKRPNDLPLDLWLGVVTAWVQEERPDLGYDDVLGLFDESELEIILGGPGDDPKVLASVVAMNGS